MYCYAECRYAEYHCAECRYAECHYAECRGTEKLTWNKSSLLLKIQM
jgi:hypothetical protein